MSDAAGSFGRGNHDVVKKKGFKQHEEDMGGSARNLTRRVGAAGWICWTFYNIQSRFAHSIFSHFLPSHIQVCKEFIRPPYFANCLCTLRRRQKRS